MPNFSLPDSVFTRAAEQFPTPFHLYDEQGIRENARLLNKAFAWCPSFREYFAVKALPNPAILRILKEEGCGLDCSSATELTLAKVCGFSGEEIILSANAMPPEEFAQARALGAFINLDDISDIDLLRDNGGIPETVCLRYNPGGQFSIGNTIMGNPGEAKYGMTDAQLPEALERPRPGDLPGLLAPGAGVLLRGRELRGRDPQLHFHRRRQRHPRGHRRGRRGRVLRRAGGDRGAGPGPSAAGPRQYLRGL